MSEAPPAERRWHAGLGFLERAAWSGPSALAAEDRTRGERQLALFRLLLTLGWLGIHVLAFAFGARDPAVLAGMSTTLSGVFVAGIIHRMAHRDRAIALLPLVTTLLDSAFVSITLVVMLSLGTAQGALYALCVFPGYLLAIMGTILRQDPRLCMLGGLAALLQYEAIAIWVEHFLAPASATLGGLYTAPMDMALELGPALFLFIGTSLATSFVLRTQQLRQLAVRDPLTGLPNRAYLDHQLIQETRHALAVREPYTVVILDIDHFKGFNDGYGHAAGDAALRTVAAVLNTAFRTTDLVVRYGGEEFVALMLGTRSEQVRKRLEHVRRSVEQAPIRLGPVPDPVHVTLSAGVATYPQDGHDPVSLLEVADKRLYRAKARGRNQIIDRGA